jgi:hypothetical protein
VRCVPVDPQPDSVGEPCTVEGGPTTGLDSCDIGLLCWDVDQDTSTGECVPLCVTDENSPVCEYADHTCSISGSGFAICLPSCDPLAQDCDPNQGCWPLGDEGFVCTVDASGDMGALGDGCEFINNCDPGLYCAWNEAVPGCAGTGCCTEYCDLDAPSCAYAEQECIPFFVPAEAPWGLDDVGVCAVP